MTMRDPATNTYQGFDIDVSLQIGLRLGVEPCFVTPSFLAVESGNWGNRWDISVGSMRITPERMRVLAFTTPYYSLHIFYPLSNLPLTSLIPIFLISFLL